MLRWNKSICRKRNSSIRWLASASNPVPFGASQSLHASGSYLLSHHSSSPHGTQGADSSSKPYESYKPTSLFQKLALAVNSGFQAFADPGKTDQVAVLGETTGHLVLPSIRSKMLLDPAGRRILRERPVVTSQTLPPEYLSTLPPNSFGYAYYVGFLKKYNVTPDSRSPVHYVDNDEEAYVMLRYRQIHDFWHTLTGVPVSVLGEVGLKVFEFVQTGLPMTALSSMLGPLKLTKEERGMFWKGYVPWALSCGSQCKFLMNVYYEELLEKDLEDLRKELNIWIPPFLKELQKNAVGDMRST